MLVYIIVPVLHGDKITLPCRATTDPDKAKKLQESETRQCDGMKHIIRIIELE